jgi:hypothetical protein
MSRKHKMDRNNNNDATAPPQASKRTATIAVGKDQLAGVYYHLGIGQQFYGIFVRMK